MNSLWRWRLTASLLVAGASPTVPFAQSLPEAAELPTKIERRLEQELDVQRAAVLDIGAGVRGTQADPYVTGYA